MFIEMGLYRSRIEFLVMFEVFIMKTSHKSDELKKKLKKRGGPQIGYLWSNSKDFYKFSFFPNTISVWNSLPQSIALSPNLESFKSGISTLTFEGFSTHL